ncbi:antiholin-like murein hydrolase modulator LrgA [Bacillus safensis]|uniref:antiholin-like murein hydrolase modulator LrgA n=1 Tax=Bacillus safensis TaxID=561879 RepID=UPI0030CE442F
MSATKVYGFLSQAFIFATVMFVSNLISMYLPIPMPASVIGLVLLFVLLTTKIVKLEQVEQLGTSLTGLISFLFVPSGISVIQSLGVMQEVGVQVVGVIIIATIMLLAATGLFSQLLMQLSGRPQKRKETKESKSAHCNPL